MVSNDINNKKRILFIAPDFQPLQKQIHEELINKGYEVEWVKDKLFISDPLRGTNHLRLWGKIWNVLFRKKYKYIKDNYNHILNQHWDILFCINGTIITPELIKGLKKNNPKIRTILYLWDHTKYYKFNKHFKYFDKVYSFDPENATKYQISYLPLFWTPVQSHDKNKIKKYAISFIGKLHSDRYDIVTNLKNECNRLDLKYFLKIVVIIEKWTLIKKIFYIRDRILGRKTITVIKHNLRKKNLEDDILTLEYFSDDVFKQIIESSNCIFDCELPNQTGLTIRSIQALSQKRKLITTNEHIKVDPFFKDNPNIFITNRSDLNIDLRFINQEFIEKQDYEIIFEQLRIDNWISKILN